MFKKSTLKIIVIGESSVGKTSLIRQYVNNSFSPQYKATIGADFLSKEITLENKTLAMQIWDTAGQEKYHSLQGVFYKGADACVIVFDLTNMHSFQTLSKWKEEFENYARVRDPSKFPFVIIGNKSDLVSERKVAKEKAEKTCEEMGIKYFEASAKTGNNVAEGFEEISRKFISSNAYHKIDLVNLGTGESKKLVANSEREESGCQC